MNFIAADVEAYAFEHTQSEPVLLQQLAEETKAKMQSPQMLTGRMEGRLLKFLAQLSSARRVLELGTFTGYSALSMAEAMPQDGEVVTCELEPVHAAFAQRYFDRSPHGKKITIRMGRALDTLASLRGPFDMAFIDADKENYPAYYAAVLALLRPGGLLLVDNTLWSGQVLNPRDPESMAIHQLNQTILADARVENVLLTVRDGLQVVRKKG